MKLKILIGRKSKIFKANQNKSKISQTTKKLTESILKIREIITCIIKIITKENIDTQEGIEIIPTKISITSRKMIKMFSYEITNIYKKDHCKINKLIRKSLKTIKIRCQINRISFKANLKITSLAAEEEEEGVEEVHIINKIIQDLSIIIKIVKIMMAKIGFMKEIDKIVDGIKRMKEMPFVILINIIIIVIIIIIIIIRIKVNATIVRIIIKITTSKIIKAIISKITKTITSKIINSKIIEAKEIVVVEEEKEEEGLEGEED